MEQKKNTQQATNTEKSEYLRRNVLHLLCGGYLCYLAYQLGTSFASGIAEKGWTGEMVVSLLGTVVFALVGGVLLVRLVRRVIAQSKQNNTEEENT